MISLLFAGILGFILLFISRATIKARRKYKISIGYGDKKDPLANLVSAHANFCAYTPFFLILLFLLENTHHFANSFLIVIASCFTVGRIIHFFALSKMELKSPPNFNYRVTGMVLTLTSIGILSLSAILFNLYTLV
ncbi:MAG TPA: MAPEG family protein [Oligoflexia bacterium]|nr:MAPEG family protein [Oligoflexia bacterium]HMR24333.1 MAPEG family protein [Oligoflexia bacterium]